MAAFEINILFMRKSKFLIQLFMKDQKLREKVDVMLWRHLVDVSN